MRLINEEGEYWTERKDIAPPRGFWSKFKLLKGDTRDFWILQACVLWFGMKLCGIKVKMRRKGKKK